MYPLLCSGGFPVPEKSGVLTVVGVLATPVIVGSAVDVNLRDDNQTASPASENLNSVVKFKNDGNKSEFVFFDPPMKTRKGLKATKLTNAVCTVYVR